MPRLRYLKKYNRIEVEYEDDQPNQQNWTSGQSWLSNNAIIASFTEIQLKQALAYYRVLVDRLEQELWLRQRSCGVSYPNTNTKSNVPNEPYIARRSIQAIKPNRRTKGKAGIFKGLKLTPQLKKELQQCLKNLLT